MTWYFPQSGTDLPNLAAGDDVFVAQQVFLNDVIYGLDTSGGHEVIVAGTVARAGITIVLGSDNGAANIVTVETTGQVRVFDGSSVVMYGADQQLINHGLITQTSPDVGNYEAIYFHSSGTAPTAISSFVNTGTVSAEETAIFHQTSDQTLTVANSGSISAGIYSFRSDGTSKDEITNTGTMIGHVALGEGDDLYDGRLGTIDGDVLGAEGIDRLYAGAGNNNLFGGDGNDTLMGGAGADYLSGGTGTDRASYASATKAVTVSLSNPAINSGDAKGDTFDSIENLSGSNYSDHVFGNSAANAINGGAGNDTIKGYAGNDTLTGYSGADIFVFNSALSASTNVDTITDFSVAADTIQLDNLVFAALTATGVLASAAFRANATGLAADADDRVIYETDTGELYYDADGNGAGVSGILFAKLGLGLGLTNADFVVI